MVLQSHRLATAHAALASTGIPNLKPGSTNTVLESMRFSLDNRAPADSTVETLEARIKADFEKIAAGQGSGSLNESVTKGWPCSIKSRRIAFPLLSGFIRTASKLSLKLRRPRLG